MRRHFNFKEICRDSSTLYLERNLVKISESISISTLMLILTFNHYIHRLYVIFTFKIIAVRTLILTSDIFWSVDKVNTLTNFIPRTIFRRGNAAWVRMGTKKLFNSLNKEDAKTYRIIERIRHPWYKQPSEYHDIALLKLESDVEFTFWIRPCCLPYSLPDVGINGNATAMGWGNTEWGKINNSKTLITLIKD